MTVKNCPHCNHEVPPEFAVMPVCMICGGDLNAAPTQVWEAVDIKNQTTSDCPQCHTPIASILALECPNCGYALRQSGPAVSDPVAPPVIPDTVPVFAEPQAPATPPLAAEPVAPPAMPEPVAAAPAKPAVPPPSLAPVPDKPVSRPAEPLPAFGQAPPPAAPPVKEGFFAKLLRALGLKK
ncbi:MAG: double zinc ribbon domain-containing protein [Candidatus Sericytochromatia bacterium]